VLEKLDRIAAAMDRPRSRVCLRLSTICRRQGAEILDVQEGIAELDRGQSEPFDDAMARLEEVVAKAERKRTPS
jgi:predicted transcriptional regulator